MRVAVAGLLAAVASGRVPVGPLPLAAQEVGCPEPEPGPPADLVAPDWSGRSSAYWNWGNGLERHDMGTGLLDVAEPATAGPTSTYDWRPGISLPLWFRPSDAEVGVWIHRGWWIPVGAPDDPLALTYLGMVETESESSRLIVTEARDDGWLEVWVDIGPAGRAATSGLMWTHRCLLALGEIALEYVRWSERFVGPGAPPLSLRDTARHALRERGEREAPPIVWLESDDEVALLEIDGDRARVRVMRPGIHLTGCEGEAWDGETFEGWVRRRDDERGTWLWCPTRGC